MNLDVRLFVDGAWSSGATGRSAAILNPANDEEIGRVAFAETEDLDRAVAAAIRGFHVWRRTSAFDRYRLMRKAAEIVRARADEFAATMTAEQGKPLAEARQETRNGADTIDWFAEEARRLYGRIVPARSGNVRQSVIREPVGPVAAFTPWNFPINQAVRKISAALAAGCSIVLKGPEETPASCAALVAAFEEAGVPGGVVNLVFGEPADISGHLIPHDGIRKVSFTGSTAVGKQLAALAGAHMKRITLELGGHAPVIVFPDADLDQAVPRLVAAKFRNAGQVCVSPTRFIVHESLYDDFTNRFVDAARAVRVGDGTEDGVAMGPLANHRRVEAMQRYVGDAVSRGATVACGGERIGNKGNFFAPTVLTDVPSDALILHEEPFGPVAPIGAFASYDEALTEANRLPYGLAAYAYTSSAETAEAVSTDIESGMVAINHHGLGLPEIPFGGVKESGYGSEGGSEAIDSYVVSKLVTHQI